jgi:hypothetical protein
MFLTDEEREVLKRILERLLAPAAAPQVLTLREAREARRKAEEDGQKKG